MKFRLTALYFVFAALASIGAGAEVSQPAEQAGQSDDGVVASDTGDSHASVHTSTYTNGDSIVAITRCVRRIAGLSKVRIVVSTRRGRLL